MARQLRTNEGGPEIQWSLGAGELDHDLEDAPDWVVRFRTDLGNLPSAGAERFFENGCFVVPVEEPWNH